jgi:hypothetical protein
MHEEKNTDRIFSLADKIYGLLVDEYKVNNSDQDVTCALEVAATLWNSSTFPGVPQAV